MAQVSAGVRADDGEGVDNNERYEISLGRDCIRANGPISRQTTPIWVTGSSLEQRKTFGKGLLSSFARESKWKLSELADDTLDGRESR